MIPISQLLLYFLILCQLSLTDLFAEECRPPLARQVVDQLMVGDIDHANEILDLWQQQSPDNELAHQFYRSMTLWTVAEISLDMQKKAAQEAALISLEKTLSSIEENGAAVSDNVELRLLTGMTQAFAGRIYLERNHWFDAYKYGRAGRDTLRKLIQDHPSSEDAYLILGLYEYYAGSVPESLRWLTSLIDLDGDAALGLQYLERAAQYSTIAGPEAARMLLNGIKFVPAQGCGYLALAASMRNYYGTEPLYSFDLQRRYLACGHPHKAADENLRLIQQQEASLDENSVRQNNYLALLAARNSGNIDAVEKLKNRFINDIPFWTLSKAQTFDVNKQRDQALALYKKLANMTGSPWIKDNSKAYADNPYRPPEVEYENRQISLLIPCKDTF